MTRALLSRLRRDRRGTSATEFAILAPAMIILLAGSIEASHFVMVKVALEGSVSTAAREAVAKVNLSDEARDAQMRARITSLMAPHKPAPGKTISISTTVYRSFGNSYPEGYTDDNGNGLYDEGEPFDDRNKNGVRDTDVPVAGKMGDVGDVVAYHVVFPTAPYFAFLTPVFGKEIGLTSSTVARNEPEKAVVTP